MEVAQDLDLDMTGAGNVRLQEDGAVAEGGGGEAA